MTWSHSPVVSLWCDISWKGPSLLRLNEGAEVGGRCWWLSGLFPLCLDSSNTLTGTVVRLRWFQSSVSSMLCPVCTSSLPCGTLPNWWQPDPTWNHWKFSLVTPITWVFSVKSSGLEELPVVSLFCIIIHSHLSTLGISPLNPGASLISISLFSQGCFWG